ncbi:hypothetical protein DL771_000808 [Monosporascus sp. 5C6A]|nr:hypothetical protein DL771_000808 [Monosporascus sp. 5C6A]
MSGMEVAGVVLGAFPVALEALEKYREVATRAGLFHRIKLKHRQCRNRLERERLVFTGNLKQLLLPVITDDEKIAEMLSNPGGLSWEDKATSDLLRARLMDSHDMYMDCIEHLDGVMKELIQVLALDSDTVQKSLTRPNPSTTKERFSNAMTRTGMEYQAYKIKFSNGENVRNNLFKELNDYNKTLEQLLGISDKETQLLQDRQASAVTSAVDSAVLFAKPEDSQWRIQETKISEDDSLASESAKNKEQVLQGQVSKFPNRRQRLALSSILSSSFLQLLNTPWLTVSWTKSDIIFMDSNESGTYALDRPHLYRNLAARDGAKQSDEDITKSLRQLGIVLLELCFGKLLGDQPCRRKLPCMDDEKVKFALDLTAALDWLQEVEGETGPDYACAVKWCLVATRPSHWRQEMLKTVVKPLKECHQWLISQGC